MNFKYNIDQSTQYGVISARYYKEWKNRNGGGMSGNFYEMQDGNSYNEKLINTKECHICGMPLTPSYSTIMIIQGNKTFWNNRRETSWECKNCQSNDFPPELETL